MGVMVGLFLFMVGMIIFNFIDIDTWEDGTDSLIKELNCDDSGISDGTKLTCLMGELALPYFIIVVISAAGGIITSKLTT